MSLIEDKQRGRFTANKEIVSLLGGMVFSFAMGSLMDYFEAQNNMQMAFIIGGITLFLLMTLHTCTLLFSEEKPSEKTKKVSVLAEIKGFIKDKTLFKIVLISVFWNIAHFVTTPFMGTYQKTELGFTAQISSIIIIVANFSRALISRPFSISDFISTL
jgi:Na+/melibiose symporter-like transporter